MDDLADCLIRPGEIGHGAGACRSRPGNFPQMVFLAGESCDLSLNRIDSEVAGATLRDGLERLPGCGETGLLARDFLEARQNLIAIGRIILDQARPAACLVRGNRR